MVLCFLAFSKSSKKQRSNVMIFAYGTWFCLSHMFGFRPNRKNHKRRVDSLRIVSQLRSTLALEAAAMAFMNNAVFYLICSAWLCCTVSAFGRHAAQYGLFQMPPSFARDGVHMYPSLHPAHNASDLKHLEPDRTKQLYYSQEGHRRGYSLLIGQL